jgi:hypothetical protein
MKTNVKLFILISFILFSCGGNAPLHQKSPEELRQELKTKEQTDFRNYLSVEYNLTKTFWTEEDVIKGSITNTASIARFKDIVITITFFTATDTELGSKDFVEYKFFEPNSKTAFEIKTKSPSATKKIGVTIKSAVPVD